MSGIGRGRVILTPGNVRYLRTPEFARPTCPGSIHAGIAGALTELPG